MSAAERAARERAAQGLPPQIADASALAQIAELMTSAIVRGEPAR